MTGYSGTPLVTKLGIKEGHRLAFPGAPEHFAGLLGELPAGLWIAWPKRASGIETDMTEDVARDLGYANKLVDNKVCAIDDTWSGLRLVIRLKDR